jgi:hypothetical protein
LAPAFEAADRRPAKLAAVARTGAAFAKAVSALDQDALSFLEMGFMTIERKKGSQPEEALSRAAFSIKQMHRSGEDAHYAAANATRLIRQMRRPKMRRAVDGLVVAFAVAYGVSFGEQATPSKTGGFAKLLPHLLKFAKVRAAIGTDRLKGILKGATLPGSRRAAGRPAAK